MSEITSSQGTGPHFMLTDPMLQNPTPNSVNVVWFTLFPGKDHYVKYGKGLRRTSQCCDTALSHIKESQSGDLVPVYRHEAVLKKISPRSQTRYRAVSCISKGKKVFSAVFSCRASPRPHAPLHVLLTSDHQCKPMVPANLQKVQQTIPKIDAIFYGGDCVTNPDSLEDWFGQPSTKEPSENRSFFPTFQGRGHIELGGTCYRGAPLLQTAPIFCAMGNHEIMGRRSDKPLKAQTQDAFPKELAVQQYRQLFPDQTTSVPTRWLEEHSFNTDSFKEIFSFPKSPQPGEGPYYATTFGDIRLVVLCATRVGRDAQLGIKGKYSEDPADFKDSSKWGFGEFIVEPLEKGSRQYQWLEEELQSKPFQTAKFKIVMLHNPIHTLGENQTPPFAPPIQHIERDPTGAIRAVSYEYPKQQDLLIRDVDPLFATYGVQLVICAHSHIWNRFTSHAGVHYLESSNVGNSYGAIHQGAQVFSPQCEAKGVPFQEPNGLSPVVPTISPLKSSDGESLPFIASNEITVFSVLDTKNGCINSYYFDTRKNDAVVLFDSFSLNTSTKIRS